ncbi:TrbI/VirB10 family protein [uncultured Sphingomonas sp.]|uniref:TrbI/VirB10 family protein n=1 Tax=uncultured Sphingomonas sp. TaxID=158754 RepID=UPI0025E0D2B3|nr:TrbI/VirB10 family protein [uncultured Sphingomonas sp.]
MSDTITRATPAAGTVVVLRPISDLDPRGHMDPQSLALATRNSFPVVAQRRGKSDGMGMAAGVGVALLLGGATFWSMSGHRSAPQQSVQPAPSAVVAPLPAPPPPVPQAAPPVPVVMPVIPPQAITPAPNPTGVLGDAAERRRAPAVVFDASGAPASGTASGPTAPGTPKPGTAQTAGGGENEQFAARLSGEASDTATATSMANPASTVTQGTLIPAVLETAIDTDLPGYVRAVVSRDIKAFDGRSVLIPRSSRLIGQYKSGLQAGQRRAYVIWTRLIRPDGASIALASPATDFAGRSGLGGQVDGHFLKRFGSAMLLSVVDALGTIGSGGSSVILGGGQNAAGVAAQRDGQIPPTIRVRQGEPIRVFTARDLDFSTVGEWVKE